MNADDVRQIREDRKVQLKELKGAIDLMDTIESILRVQQGQIPDHSREFACQEFARHIHGDVQPGTILWRLY